MNILLAFSYIFCPNLLCSDLRSTDSFRRASARGRMFDPATIAMRRLWMEYGELSAEIKREAEAKTASDIVAKLEARLEELRSRIECQLRK